MKNPRISYKLKTFMLVVILEYFGLLIINVLRKFIIDEYHISPFIDSVLDLVMHFLAPNKKDPMKLIF